MLTWDTPQERKRRHADTDNLRYKNRAHPRNVIVARSAKGILFTERASFPWNSYPTALRPTSVRLTSQARRTLEPRKDGRAHGPSVRRELRHLGFLTPFTLIDANWRRQRTGWDSPEWLYTTSNTAARYTIAERDVGRRLADHAFA